MPVESGKLKLNLKGGTPWIEKKKKKKKSKIVEADAEPETQEGAAQEARASATTTSNLHDAICSCSLSGAWASIMPSVVFFPQAFLALLLKGAVLINSL